MDAFCDCVEIFNFFPVKMNSYTDVSTAFISSMLTLVTLQLTSSFSSFTWTGSSLFHCWLPLPAQLITSHFNLDFDSFHRLRFNSFQLSHFKWYFMFAQRSHLKWHFIQGLHLNFFHTLMIQLISIFVSWLPLQLQLECFSAISDISPFNAYSSHFTSGLRSSPFNNKKLLSGIELVLNLHFIQCSHIFFQQCLHFYCHFQYFYLEMIQLQNFSSK